MINWLRDPATPVTGLTDIPYLIPFPAKPYRCQLQRIYFCAVGVVRSKTGCNDSLPHPILQHLFPWQTPRGTCASQAFSQRVLSEDVCCSASKLCISVAHRYDIDAAGISDVDGQTAVAGFTGAVTDDVCRDVRGTFSPRPAAITLACIQ